MKSIWNEDNSDVRFPQLEGDLSTEAVVIGGGMAGILTAYFLQKRGVETVLLEADVIGGGQTQNTTAKITAQHGFIYKKLLTELGSEKALYYASVNQRAVLNYQKIIEEERISCHFEMRPAYLYTTGDPSILHEEAEASERLGLPVSFTDCTELPFAVAGAVRMERQAQFHPLEFLRSISRKLTIYEHTRVTGAEGGTVRTDRGTVSAKWVIFAVHFPFLNFPGEYFMRMHQERSYVLALHKASALRGMYLGVGPDSLSFRCFEDTLLLGGSQHRTGENRGGGCYEALRKRAKEFWPDSIETAHWSAQDCMTLDGVPYIGPYASSHPEWYVATGFGKWGMTNSMAAAMLLSSEIVDGEAEGAEVFSPGRLTLLTSSRAFFSEGFHAVRDLTRQMFGAPRADIDALPLGHGGVVDCDGDKVGVYKDENGEVYMVDTRCPHLGCQVEWNPDERSWDCPCHGSRFDYQGHLIDNPAQQGLDIPFDDVRPQEALAGNGVGELQTDETLKETQTEAGEAEHA